VRREDYVSEGVKRGRSEPIFPFSPSLLATVTERERESSSEPAQTAVVPADDAGRSGGGEVPAPVEVGLVVALVL
jgi:hypothetical protein